MKRHKKILKEDLYDNWVTNDAGEPMGKENTYSVDKEYSNDSEERFDYGNKDRRSDKDKAVDFVLSTVYNYKVDGRRKLDEFDDYMGTLIPRDKFNYDVDKIVSYEIEQDSPMEFPYLSLFATDNTDGASILLGDDITEEKLINFILSSIEKFGEDHEEFLEKQKQKIMKNKNMKKLKEGYGKSQTVNVDVPVGEDDMLKIVFKVTSGEPKSMDSPGFPDEIEEIKYILYNNAELGTKWIDVTELLNMFGDINKIEKMIDDGDWEVDEPDGPEYDRGYQRDMMSMNENKKKKKKTIKLTESQLKRLTNLITEQEESGSGMGRMYEQFTEKPKKSKEMSEEDTKADKDYDGDGKIESSKDEYMGSKDKAIKKAMKKDTHEGEHEEEMKEEEFGEMDQEDPETQVKVDEVSESSDDELMESIKRDFKRFL